MTWRSRQDASRPLNRRSGGGISRGELPEYLLDGFDRGRMTGHVKRGKKIFGRCVELFDLRRNVLEQRFIFILYEKCIRAGYVTTCQKIAMLFEQVVEAGQARAEIVVTDPFVIVVVVDLEFDWRYEPRVVFDDEDLWRGAGSQQLVHEIVIVAVQIHGNQVALGSFNQTKPASEQMHDI